MNRNNVLSRKAYLSLTALLLTASTVVAQKSTEQRANVADKFKTEKVSVAYAEAQNREETTISSSSVVGDDVRGINTANIGNILFGKMPGLLAMKKSGFAGDDTPGMTIRGRHTFMDNAILILVDGFETKWQNLTINEIDNITVLKDAAATALYGMRAANGVVLITTKRGTNNGNHKINFNARWGIFKPAFMPELLNNGEYAEMYNQAMISDGKDPANGYFKTPQIVDYFKNGSQPYLYPDVDWYKEVTKPTTFAQEYDLSLSGGGQVAQYFVAMGFRDDQGLYDNTDKKRNLNSNQGISKYSVRSNVNVKINKWLSSEVSLRGTMEDKKNANADVNDIWKTMTLFNPYPVRNPDNTWGGKEGYSQNPVARIIQQGYTTVNERTVDASVKLKADLSSIVSGLSIFGQIQFSNNYWSHYNKTRGYAYSELTPNLNAIGPDGEIPYTSVVKGDTETGFAISQPSGHQWNRNTIQTGAEYQNTFGKHSVYASAIYRQYTMHGRASDLDTKEQGIMGRLRYDYEKKYLAELGFAYSGSENFPEGSRFGFFPTLSGAWILSKENFLKNSKIVDFLKLRASVGLTGNRLPGEAGRLIFYQYYGNGGNYLLGSNNFDKTVTGYKQFDLANPNVTWEKALQMNFGIDAVLVNKFTVSLEYFYEDRFDIGVNPATYLPSLIGASFDFRNDGKASNQGFEADLRYDDRFGKVGISVGARFAFSRSKVVDKKEAPKSENYLYEKNRPIGQPFMLEAIGFFKDENDIASSPTQLYGAVKPGDIKYRDRNGDGYVDDNDRIAVGYSGLPEIDYGFDIALTYKGFDISAWAYGATNRSVSILDSNNFIPFLNGGVKPSQWVKDNHWTPARGDQAKFPRLTTEQSNNNQRASTLWTRDGSYFRIKNIEIGYTFPSTWMNKVKIDKLRVYANVNDPFAFSPNNEMDLDPEIRNIFTYPSMRSINFGIGLTF